MYNLVIIDNNDDEILIQHFLIDLGNKNLKVIIFSLYF